ncbi:MAG: biopolymer transporter ExbD [Bacteroidetes bacterium]|nr:biopolymer transporter ExbD [Bacteroidota bacterium]
MAIKTRNKVSVSFSMSSMTDIVFLLLIFFMITSTLVHPTALKLLLPKGGDQTGVKPQTTVSITRDLDIFVNVDGNNRKVSYSDLERILLREMKKQPDAYIFLHADKTVPIQEVVKVMDIANKNNFRLSLATTHKE